jgi:hypothetical protein
VIEQISISLLKQLHKTAARHICKAAARHIFIVINTTTSTPMVPRYKKITWQSLKIQSLLVGSVTVSQQGLEWSRSIDEQTEESPESDGKHIV